MAKNDSAGNGNNNNNEAEGENVDALKLNVNQYATKKTIGQGVLDIALIIANAAQLRRIIQDGEDHQYYSLFLALVIVSIILQVTTGLLLGFLAYLDMNNPKNRKLANLINDIVTVKLVLISLVNVVISSFEIEST